MMDGRTMVIGTEASHCSTSALFPERLGEGVGVGPSGGERPSRARLDQFVVHPVLSEALGPRWR